MTLSTHVQLLEASEAELQELFLVMRDLAGIPPEWPWLVREYGWSHVSGTPDARARVDMWRGAAEWKHGEPYTTVRWDTPYGYGYDGETCSQLHARFLVELAERRPQWRERLRWENEFTGEWFTMDTDPRAELCGGAA